MFSLFMLRIFRSVAIFVISLQLNFAGKINNNNNNRYECPPCGNYLYNKAHFDVPCPQITTKMLVVNLPAISDSAAARCGIFYRC